MSCDRRTLFVAFGGLFLLNACKLVDQRTFNPKAGRRPLPYIPPAPPPVPPPAPPIEIIENTDKGQWLGPLKQLVKNALSRKADAMFMVTAVIPTGQSPDEQQKSLLRLTTGDAQEIAKAIIDAGASSEQVQIAAQTDGFVKKNVIRVYIQ